MRCMFIDITDQILMEQEKTCLEAQNAYSIKSAANRTRPGRPALDDTLKTSSGVVATPTLRANA